MKKMTINMIVISMLLSVLSGCGKEVASSVTENIKNEAILTSDKNIVIPDVAMQQFDIPDNEALEFVHTLKIGWNLGNTFDANTDGNSTSDEMNYETLWCKTKTTKEMIDTIKEAGFNTVRIPVSWHNHLEDEEFIISKAWMDRVQEVVDYVMKNDMYAIINIHHDIDKSYYYPTSECLENSTKYMNNIWTQISERFKDYDEHLIFEGINEPRLKGESNEWNFDPNIPSCEDAAKCINTLNQVFVDVVRKSGGKNVDRYLMVPAYIAGAEPSLYDIFKLPEDTQENKIILSIHAYTPYAFALQPTNESGSTANWSVDNTADQQGVTTFMDGLYYKYVSKGKPVVIGEFGARDKEDNLQSRVDFATYYIAAARTRGISCIWWDNNNFEGSGENFGLLDRKTNIWPYKEIVDGLMKYAD
ncbi:glycoside hydrolase family 5 protein [Cellulosilyticum ruminicola]